ncbi:unnamed protein product [Sphenostylis stenocarpa]|uniref:Uncharacterized protein n=1 Tax=Sphenostylis stenocarpa TaxID=92480 RepID=A0AA86SPW7_9FABA|nr:unnamed protein product [Sphenostylis stenocarpa]
MITDLYRAWHKQSSVLSVWWGFVGAFLEIQLQTDFAMYSQNIQPPWTFKHGKQRRYCDDLAINDDIHVVAVDDDTLLDDVKANDDDV